jgi:hypothetical protein
VFLENVVLDAVEPQRLGRFWEAVLGAERLTDEPDLVEVRLTVEGGPTLDLCFPRVAEPVPEPARLHLDLVGGIRRTEVVQRLVERGARRLDSGRPEAAWVELADPEGNPCRVLGDRAVLPGTGPVAAFSLSCAEPDRDAELWSWLTGWTEVAGAAPRSLRHRSRRGPVLELWPETAPKGTTKNRLHLDVRLEPDDDPDAVADGIVQRGGRELHPGWGELPWRVHADASGNELCVLPART